MIHYFSIFMRKLYIMRPAFAALAFTIGMANPVSAARFFGFTIPSLNEVKRVWAQDVEPPREPQMVRPEVEEDMEEPRDMVDPRELQGVRRETADQLQNIKRLTATAKRAKAAKELEELSRLQKRVLEFQSQFKALQPDDENAREIIESYRDEQLWDAINDIRRRVELPKELAEIAKRVKEAEKLLNNKQVQRAFTDLGGDIEKLKSTVASMKEAHAVAQKAMQEGNVEDADDALADIREGGHPGELLGILHGMRQFGGRLRAIRDTEIRDGIKEIVQPIIEALNNGDIRDARMTIDEMGPEIERMMKTAMKLLKKNRGQFIDGLQKLEQRINEKLEQEGMKGEQKEEGSNN